MSLRKSHGQGEIIIRPVHRSDATAIYDITANRQVARFTDHLPGLEYSQLEDWLTEHKEGQYRFVAEFGGEVSGLAWLQCHSRPRINHIGDLKLIVHPDHWGQGMGTSLAKTMVDLADNWLNLKRLQVDVLAGNEAALRLLDNLEFETEGIRRQSLLVDGRFQDEIHLSRLRGFNGINGEALVNEISDRDPLPGSPSNHLSKSGVKPIQVEIRPLGPDDADDLYEIFRQRQVCRTTLQMPSQEYSANLKRMRDLPPNLHRFVAVTQERVVGTISLRQLQLPRRSHLGWLGMAVHPEFWGLGIGSRLMEATLDLADNWLDLKRVELDVNTDNPGGIRLYQKFDFAIEGVKRFHAYGDGRWGHSYFMARIR